MFVGRGIYRANFSSAEKYGGNTACRLRQFGCIYLQNLLQLPFDTPARSLTFPTTYYLLTFHCFFLHRAFNPICLPHSIILCPFGHAWRHSLPPKRATPSFAGSFIDEICPFNHSLPFRNSSYAFSNARSFPFTLRNPLLGLEDNHLNTARLSRLTVVRRLFRRPTTDYTFPSHHVRFLRTALFRV